MTYRGGPFIDLQPQRAPHSIATGKVLVGLFSKVRVSKHELKWDWLWLGDSGSLPVHHIEQSIFENEIRDLSKEIPLLKKKHYYSLFLS